MGRAPRWQLQDAKNRLSTVVDEAVRSGPQIITRRGQDTAVVLSFRDWSKLARRGERLIDVLRRGPKVQGGLDIERSQDTGRPVEV